MPVKYLTISIILIWLAYLIAGCANSSITVGELSEKDFAHAKLLADSLLDKHENKHSSKLTPSERVFAEKALAHNLAFYRALGTEKEFNQLLREVDHISDLRPRAQETYGLDRYEINQKSSSIGDSDQPDLPRQPGDWVTVESEYLLFFVQEGVLTSRELEAAAAVADSTVSQMIHYFNRSPSVFKQRVTHFVKSSYLDAPSQTLQVPNDSLIKTDGRLPVYLVHGDAAYRNILQGNVQRGFGLTTYSLSYDEVQQMPASIINIYANIRPGYEMPTLIHELGHATYFLLLTDYEGFNRKQKQAEFVTADETRQFIPPHDLFNEAFCYWAQLTLTPSAQSGSIISPAELLAMNIKNNTYQSLASVVDSKLKFEFGDLLPTLRYGKSEVMDRKRYTLIEQMVALNGYLVETLPPHLYTRLINSHAPVKKKIESTLGKSLDEVEKDWKEWALQSIKDSTSYTGFSNRDAK